MVSDGCPESLQDFSVQVLMKVGLETVNPNFREKEREESDYSPLGQGPILIQSSEVRGLVQWPVAHSVGVVEAHF